MEMAANVQINFFFIIKVAGKIIVGFRIHNIPNNLHKVFNQKRFLLKSFSISIIFFSLRFKYKIRNENNSNQLFGWNKLNMQTGQ